jgi:hypothetical protein
MKMGKKHGKRLVKYYYEIVNSLGKGGRLKMKIGFENREDNKIVILDGIDSLVFQKSDYGLQFNNIKEMNDAGVNIDMQNFRIFGVNHLKLTDKIKNIIALWKHMK